MEPPPLSEVQLYDILLKVESELRPKAERIWAMIKIEPERWNVPEYGSGSANFWVVGLIGDRVLWYNEIESEFVISHYETYGQIGQDAPPGGTELRFMLEHMIRQIVGELAYSS